MWVFLWLALSAFVMGVFVWSMMILFQQKRVWSAFAKQKKLNYKSGGLNGAPLIKGRVEQFKIAFFTDTQPTPDARGERYVTVIEIEMGAGMSTGGAIATEDFSSFLDTVNFNESFVPELPEWDESYLIRARERAGVVAYLTPERAKVLTSVFKMKNTGGLLFFDELEAVLRVEMTDPLKTPDLLEKVTRRLIAASRVLAPTEQEKRANEDRRKEAELKEKERLAKAAQEQKKEEEDRAIPLKPLEMEEQ